jgi:hypothetical protein
LSEPAEAEGEAVSRPVYYDVNNDGYLTPVDALQVINILNVPDTEAEGEAEGNLVPGMVVAVEQIATSPDTAGLASLSPSATASSGAIVQRRDEVFSGWATPTVEDELADSLAGDSRGRSTGGDAQLEEVIDLLSADALLSDAMGDPSSLL